MEQRFKDLGTVDRFYDPWPEEKVFPWTDAECAAFARGYSVKWPLGIDEFMMLPGRVEMFDGYVVLKQ